MVFKVLLFATTVLGVAWAYSSGAPEGVCDDMTPKHAVDPQKSPLPYKVSVDKPVVKAFDKVKITVSGKPFKGFLLQVRDGDKAVGSFAVSGDDQYAQVINCHKGSKGKNPIDKMLAHLVDRFLQFFGMSLYTGPRLNNAITHKNSSTKEAVSVEWVAPKGPKEYTVYATVAENGGVFWAKQPTATIKVQ